MDDIYFIIRGLVMTVGHAYNRIEEGLNGLERVGGSIKVEGESKVTGEGDQMRSLPFLDVARARRGKSETLRH